MKKTLALATLPMLAVLVLSGCGAAPTAATQAPVADQTVTRQADMPQALPADTTAPVADAPVVVDTTVAPITKDTSADTTLKDVDAAVDDTAGM